MTTALNPMCTVAEYDAATPQQKHAHDEWWIAHWQAAAARHLQDETQRDRDDADCLNDWWA